MTIQRDLPMFHEHKNDPLIPRGYGVEENHDGGFYPYRIGVEGDLAGLPIYLKDAIGLDIWYPSYEQAREHIAEVDD